MTSTEVLKECGINGNVVELPDVQLDRKLYLEVKNKLELIGGKWKSGRTQGFVFDAPPIDLLHDLQNREEINLKKDYQYFATPDKIADRLVELAGIKQFYSILEPSAGQGAIVKAINRVFPHQEVDCYELMPVNQMILKKIKTVRFLGEDFLSIDLINRYDYIIANPPFSNNADIQHIYRMYNLLSDNGRLVTIASLHWKLSNNKRESEFREWLKKVDAIEEAIPAGAFKESGTNIQAVILIIDKKR